METIKTFLLVFLAMFGGFFLTLIAIWLLRAIAMVSAGLDPFSVGVLP